MSTRIYKITDTQADPPATVLVRATSQAQAIAHVARSRYTVAAARPDDVAEVMGRGGQVQDAGAQQA
ncbi:hypothetical protein Psesu_1132 [Pseudoxanthomonas suwonensis 11-1]|uniref:Uncharacterized protein n=1 Tax=Pseudoxanthomonas suwonensis (strain 11-1) TaxID=743721 RepID=E6WS33_PSEUU|nr:hypothetical protein [Pseudoxanthomonas suwonensis]ADV26982.1 hypothetical protein Psesu_1132 [Pseudoxanthomonas suwonensis 11-1]